MSILANFTLPLPPSVNCLYDGGKKVKQRFKSDAYDKWCRHARQFTQAYLADNPIIDGWQEFKVPLRMPVAVMYRYGEIADKRDRDLENYVKAISDLLVDERIIVDDSMIKKTYLEWADDVEPRYVDVVILPVAKLKITIE